VTVTGTANETIGNYRVVQRLGEGAMGVVCLAQHPIIGRKVAIKLLHPALASDREVVTRFFNEARAIHKIAHENVVEILDFGETDDGQPYFIMEFLAGESLSDVIARGPMDVERAASIADQMCRALGAAHEKGIVHRDLKPQNVQLVTKADGSLQVKLLDFGVAKILATTEEGAQSARTRAGSLMGTPLYMSPEQCRGAGTVDARADVYALGVMLFEMLAGRPPFTAEGLGELFALQMFQPAPPLADFAPRVPRHVAAAIARALAKDPDARFQSMEELRAALAGELKPPEEIFPAAPDQPVDPPIRRWRIPALAGALALVVAGGFQLLPRSHRAAAAAQVALPASPPPLAATPSPPVAQPAPRAVALAPEKHPAPPPRAVTKRQPPLHRHVKRSEPAIDEDGLAKPSF
jgi:serine/threonine protein kinase